MSNRKRRGRDEGSIYQRGDGLWVASISLGYDQKGNHRRRVVYGKTKKEAQEKLRKLQAEAAGGMLPDPKRRNVTDYLHQWLETARPTIRRNTYSSYARIIRKHIVKHLGSIGLAKLAPVHVQGTYAAMEKEGASGRMRRMCHAILHRALKLPAQEQLHPTRVQAAS